MNEQEEKVIGVWSLLSLRRFRNGTFYRFPMGEDAAGRLIYTPVGIMAAFLMSREWQAGTAKPEWSSFMSYSARWHVENLNQVVHDVDTCSISALIGKPLIRYIRHQDDGAMMLLTEPFGTSSGEKSHDELLWRRVSTP